jgi:hypothetical protein
MLKELYNSLTKLLIKKFNFILYFFISVFFVFFFLYLLFFFGFFFRSENLIFFFNSFNELELLKFSNLHIDNFLSHFYLYKFNHIFPPSYV